MELSEEDRIGMYLKTMPMMLNGTLDWGKGCALRAYLNVTTQELKEHLIESLSGKEA